MLKADSMSIIERDTDLYSLVLKVFQQFLYMYNIIAN